MAVDEVDQLDPTPLFQQLAAIIRAQIQRGDLRPRQVLPSETHLIQRYGVSRGTVRQAMALLREEGWIVTVQGRGSFVAPEPPIDRDETPQQDAPDQQ